MIQAASLRKSFAGRRGLDGLTFSAGDGAITGLVGPNGSGKTTTLRLITGLFRPNSGQVLVDDIDPTLDPMGARRRMEHSSPAELVRAANAASLEKAFVELTA